MYILIGNVDKTITEVSDMYHSYYRNPEIPDNDFHNDKIPLQVNCAGRESNPKGAIANSMRRDYYLFYLAEGSVQIKAPITQTITAGDAVIFERNVPFWYFTCDKTATTHYFVHFTGASVSTVLERCSIRVNTIYSVKKSLQAEFEAVFKTFLVRDQCFDLDSAAKLTALLVAVGRYKRGENDRAACIYEDRLHKSIEYIHNHFTSEFSIADLAQLENLSESRYRAVFKSIFKVSPVQYITNLRLTTDMSVEQIADLVGYRDARYFSRLFRKKIFETPTEFRQRIYDNKQQLFE